MLLTLNDWRKKKWLITNLDAVAFLQVLGHGFDHGFKEEPGVLQKGIKWMGYSSMGISKHADKLHNGVAGVYD